MILNIKFFLVSSEFKEYSEESKGKKPPSSTTFLPPTKGNIFNVPDVSDLFKALNLNILILKHYFFSLLRTVLKDTEEIPVVD